MKKRLTALALVALVSAGMVTPAYADAGIGEPSGWRPGGPNVNQEVREFTPEEAKAAIEKSTQMARQYERERWSLAQPMWDSFRVIGKDTISDPRVEKKLGGYYITTDAYTSTMANDAATAESALALDDLATEFAKNITGNTTEEKIRNTAKFVADYLEFDENYNDLAFQYLPSVRRGGGNQYCQLTKAILRKLGLSAEVVDTTDGYQDGGAVRVVDGDTTYWSDPAYYDQLPDDNHLCSTTLFDNRRVTSTIYGPGAVMLQIDDGDKAAAWEKR